MRSTRCLDYNKRPFLNFWEAAQLLHACLMPTKREYAVATADLSVFWGSLLAATCMPYACNAGMWCGRSESRTIKEPLFLVGPPSALPAKLLQIMSYYASHTICRHSYMCTVKVPLTIAVTAGPLLLHSDAQAWWQPCMHPLR